MKKWTKIHKIEEMNKVNKLDKNVEMDKIDEMGKIEEMDNIEKGTKFSPYWHTPLRFYQLVVEQNPQNILAHDLRHLWYQTY